MILEAAPGFKFGCDPEAFIYDNNKNEYIGAEGIFPGTKEEPYKVDRGAWQVDGMAAEFNIDPATSFKEFDGNIMAVLRQGERFLPSGCEFHFLPAVRFGKKVMEAASDKAKELGCNPDFNAWTGEANPPPEVARDPLLRTAAGHLHIGWTDDGDLSDGNHIQNCRDLVKQLDWYLGAWSLRYDGVAERRSLYGKAGACRYKTYGVEYRVLSNFWVQSKAQRNEVWNRMVRAIADMARMEITTKVMSGYTERMIDSINTSKVDPIVEKMARYPIRTLDQGLSSL